MEARAGSCAERAIDTVERHCDRQARSTSAQAEINGYCRVLQLSASCTVAIPVSMTCVACAAGFRQTESLCASCM